MTFLELRKKHPVLRYNSHQIQLCDGLLKLEFEITLEPNITFRPTLEIPVPKDMAFCPENIEPLVVQLGLLECLSYWKAACPPIIEVATSALSKEQIAWWKDLLVHGLGEFFFCNQIDLSDEHLVEIRSTGKPAEKLSYPPASKEAPLILVGGGKDSALSLELLKNRFPNAHCFVLNPAQSFFRTIKHAGLDKQVLIAKRTIDPQLLELNASGYLNGHTPFSAYLAFLSTSVAALGGFTSIIASNESSADEENVVFHDIPINHQYSKSFEFEKRFKEYEAAYLQTGTNYFSFLRPIHEIQIASLFSRHEQQLEAFRSCNRGQKNDQWCSSCPKCAFVYLMLYPFLSYQKILSIFGSDLFLDEQIQQFLWENISPNAIKPFECVGSKTEALLALALSIQKRIREKRDIPARLARLLEENKDKIDISLLHDWNPHHALPEEYSTILRAEINSGLHSPILVYGLGREGQSTLAYLRKYYPEIETIVCDKEGGEELSEEDFIASDTLVSTVFRSPGIPLHAPLLARAKASGARISSLANLFFSKARGRVIGVTGTKGKSTTAALIHQMLSTVYKDVRLVGNIGVPALDHLEGANADTLFVYELSSFQLEDLKASPDISVLLDIYPEHLDHHQSFENYENAKMNIFKHQSENGVLVLSEKNTRRIPKDYPGKLITFSNQKDAASEIFLFENHIHEQGKRVVRLAQTTIHPSNILAACSASRALEVPWSHISDAIESFSPLPHRMEQIGTHHGITFINDSLSTIPEAAIYAIDCLGPKLSTLIVGGFDRGVTFKALGERIVNSHIKNIILFPSTGEKIWNSIPRSKRSELNHVFVNSMQDAVNRAYACCQPGDICLLSPASSSLNLFRDYQDRGEQFRKHVLSYSQP